MRSSASANTISNFPPGRPEAGLERRALDDAGTGNSGVIIRADDLPFFRAACSRQMRNWSRSTTHSACRRNNGVQGDAGHGHPFLKSISPSGCPLLCRLSLAASRGFPLQAATARGQSDVDGTAMIRRRGSDLRLANIAVRRWRNNNTFSSSCFMDALFQCGKQRNRIVQNREILIVFIYAHATLCALPESRSAPRKALSKGTTYRDHKGPSRRRFVAAASLRCFNP